jgi:hypothetical protein
MDVTLQYKKADGLLPATGMQDHTAGHPEQQSKQ